ncbi:MAG: MmcB family DNA repair protein [Sphingobium sp.]|uniref:hypothetical protein n=1 Tax=Sphingobium sp. TaxID=1912891 RepID=UPI001792B1D8|nr:hypothetical protein [Sphingobium sp.]MBA4756256.1 MmcB family DNA repair protein [Sphingobium sp.]
MAHSWTHDGLLDDLATHLRQPERMVWCDMQLGPSGSPRPDIFTMQKSYSKPSPAAFEIKISRSDLRSDTTSAKWQSYLKFAGSVTFAVPDGLCTVADIPDMCGLIVRKDQVWRYARRPTIQRVDLPKDAYMKLLIDGVNRTHVARRPDPRRVDLWRGSEIVRKRFGEAVEKAARDMVRFQSQIDDLKDQYDYQAGEMRRRIEVERQLLLKEAEKEIPKLTELRGALCEMLDIDPQSSSYFIRNALSQKMAACNADARVRAAEDRLRNARRAMEYALSQFPQDEPVVPVWSEQAA